MALVRSMETRSLNYGYPTSCSLCKEVVHIHEASGLFAVLLTPTLEVKPYAGTSPKVLLIGQDPTLRNKRVGTALEFDREKSPLRQYIVNYVLAPLGLTTDDVYVTNAVKCTFPGQHTPADWAKGMCISVENFLIPFFMRCKRYLTKELISIKPKIVITFGQPAHRLLVSAYRWEISPDMKEAFGHVFPVDNPIPTVYVPVIHYNSRGHRYYKTRWSMLLYEVREALEGRRAKLPKGRTTAWLKKYPKEAKSIHATLAEVAHAVRVLKARQEGFRNNEAAREYPQSKRVEKYEQQIVHLEKVLGHLENAMAELSLYERE